MKLYPRLSIPLARSLATDLSGLSAAEAEARSALVHDRAYYGPTGGSRTTEDDLRRLQSSVREIYKTIGLRQAECDQQVARLLLSDMDISPNEASRSEVWTFLTCVLLPDFVSHRFGTRSPVNVDRYIGGAFGGRNALGRLWWRARLLTLEGQPDAQVLLNRLGEDQFVQLLERPLIAGDAKASRAFSLAWLAAGRYADEALFRDGMKRLRRLAAFLDFRALSPDELSVLMTEVMTDSIAARNPRATAPIGSPASELGES